MDNTPIYTSIINSDTIVLEPLEKYMRDRGIVADKLRPDIYLQSYSDCRDYFYSDIAQRASRIIGYINSAPENDDAANAFKYALSRHMRDAAFLTILQKQMEHEKNMYSNALVGSFVCESIREYQEEMLKLDELDAEKAKANKKKDDKEPAPMKSHVDPEIVGMLLALGKYLLKPYCAHIQSKFVKMDDVQVLALAAIIAAGNEHVAYALMESDLPITAEILNCPLFTNDQIPKIYAGILQLQKSEWVKLSVNQAKFLESLTKWIYSRLNSLDPSLCLQLLVAAYGSTNPGDYVKTCLIQPKDCGTQYPNLKQVAISLKIN